jgi:hypothetical protein
VRAVATGSGTVVATPTVTTAYRLATATVASGAVTIKVTPTVSVSSVSATGVTGTVAPLLPNATLDLQSLNVDGTWTSLATGFVAADGTFSLPAALTPGSTVRVYVTPTTTYAPRASSALVVSG